MKGVEQIEHTLHNLASPKRGHTFWGLVAVLVVAFLFIWAKHGVWLRSPNEFMFANNPDAFKHYMTSTWHVQHDSSYVHYSGMNYPFGEHVLFTDNQPIISTAMQWWNRQVFDVGEKVVGIIQVLQVLSIVFGAGVIYLLLRKLHLAAWYAGLAAIGITFLSPQYNHFEGHFGLSHIWVVPMLLLVLCRYEERKSRRYQSLLMGILIGFAAQLHFYNLGVSAVFLSFYVLFQLLIDFSWRNIWTRLSHLAVMILLPYAGLNVWLHWSDYCADRTAAPSGFTELIGHWEGVFLPYDFFPLYQWIDRYITPIKGLDFEAQSYAGLVALFFTLWLVLKRRFRLFEPEWEQAAYHRVHKNFLRGICFAAFATLLFSFGVPFSIPGFEWMVDYLGPVRQFRGLARFTWAFYYVINILAFYVVWNKGQRIHVSERWRAWVSARSAKAGEWLPNSLKWSLLLAPIFFLCWDAYYFQQHKTLQLMPNLTQKKVVAANPDHWLNKLDFGRFQALMPLPYYHMGSENIWMKVNLPLFQKLQYTALQTGLPDMGVNLSRTSIGRTVKSIQFALPACETPALLAELPDNRPLALMIEPGQWELVQKKYPHLLSKASTVYNEPELRIMAVVPDSVRAWSRQQAEKISADMDRFATLDAKDGWRSDHPKQWYWYESFDAHHASKHIFQGKGAGEENLSDTTWILQKDIPRGSYLFSIWIKADEDMGMTQTVQFLEKDRAGDRLINFREVSLGLNIQTIVQGWALFEVPFEVQEENTTMGVFLHKKKVNAPFWFDEVLIKDNQSNLYRREPGWVIRNNYWYKLPKNSFK